MVLFAKSKKRVSAFYQETLGLRVVESESSHDLLRGTTYEIVVHAIPRKFATGIVITKPPTPREESPIKPTFVVKSLERVRAAAAKTGGLLKPASAMWNYRGYSVLDGCDPEGNPVQFKQRVAEQPHAARRDA
jgi:predicted enzyme related to lactoylglutathione lyase